MFSADLFYCLKIILQKMKRNRIFSHLTVVLNKLNDACLKINGRLVYFKIGKYTRKPIIFFNFSKNQTLVVCQDQNIVFLTLYNKFYSSD